nr:aspartyl-phosphate phosphatase Spo0E family protein [Brevibacillus laterosporus]
MSGILKHAPPIKDMVIALQQQLVALVQEKGSFSHPMVVALSKELDEYVVQLQSQRFQQYKKRRQMDEREHG